MSVITPSIGRWLPKKEKEAQIVATFEQLYKDDPVTFFRLSVEGELYLGLIDDLLARGYTEEVAEKIADKFMQDTAE